MSICWQLAIECSSTGGSIALLRQTPHEPATGELFSQTSLPADRGSVQTLAPAIADSLKQARLEVRDLSFLSVTVGPGSFTGLRVGLATAKMLSMACAKPIAPVDTLAAIARRFAQENGPSAGSAIRLVTAINAYRKQVFTASWFITAEGMWPLRRSCVVDLGPWRENPWGDETPHSPEGHCDRPDDSPRDVWISGSALAEYPLEGGSHWPLHSAAADLWQPQAVDVGALGWDVVRQGGTVSAAELLPNYIRQSAAEEKRKTQT